jgi:molybdopterin converting factor small subunit
VQVRIRVPTQLRELVEGNSVVTVDVGEGEVTVTDVLDQLAKQHPALERRVRDELGRTRTHVNLFVGDDNVRDLDGPATVIPAGADVSIIPAVSGGGDGG